MAKKNFKRCQNARDAHAARMINNNGREDIINVV